MGALPSARIEPRPLPAEAVENAVRAARKTARSRVAAGGRRERVLERDWPATPGGVGVRNRQTEVREE
jgi:hypothetical protein